MLPNDENDDKEISFCTFYSLFAMVKGKAAPFITQQQADKCDGGLQTEETPPHPNTGGRHQGLECLDAADRKWSVDESRKF